MGSLAYAQELKLMKASSCDNTSSKLICFDQVLTDVILLISYAAGGINVGCHDLGASHILEADLISGVKLLTNGHKP